MPDALAHRFFADKEIDKMPDSFKAIVKANSAYFDIGSSGPDAFYYYAFIPWYSSQKRDQVSHLGDLIHTEKINNFFEYGFTYFKQAPDYFKAYFLGFMTHYILDRNAHPFVFYRSGFSEDDKKRYYAMMHKRYEVAIDRELSMHHFGEDLYEKKHYQFLKMKHLPFSAIDDFYSKVAKSVYGLSISQKQVEQSFRSMALVFSVLHDPSGRKKKLLKHFEKPSFPLFTSAIYSKAEDDGYDVLNLEKKEWLDPCSQKPSHLSFHEIVDNAGEELQVFYQLFDAYLKDETKLNEILNFIDNRQFDTNHQPEDSKMVVHDCVYDKQR